MAKNNQKTYWPHMILGFLMLAIVLGYWTIKAATSMPVQETNDYMMKYQESDIHINEILEEKAIFDREYSIKLIDAKTMVMVDNIHSNRPQSDQVKLSMGKNIFSYTISDRDGNSIDSANVSFLLTRPHTTVDDQMIEHLDYRDGRYITPELNITKAGRYTLQFRAKIGKGTGYSSVEAYLAP
jgi:hypothetical protein